MARNVIKRDGKLQPFDRKKIKSAILKCLNHGSGSVDIVRLPGRGRQKVVVKPGKPIVKSAKEAEKLSEKITDLVVESFKDKDEVHIEDIQDTIIRFLWQENLVEAAKSYTLYREVKNILRQSGPCVEYFPENCGLVSLTQRYQFFSKFARIRYDNNRDELRYETFPEAVDRAISFLAQHVPDSEKSILDQLRRAMLELKAFPSMRLFQMAGPAAQRCNVCIYNCSYLPIRDLESFDEAFYILMQGAGVGFSVERQYVELLPVVAKAKAGSSPAKFVIPDTTEGWCEALRTAIHAAYNGELVEFDYSQIRPAGSPLKTKGGRASGPEPLKYLLDFATRTIRNAAGRRLTPIECHDIMCNIGKIVQVGGVRRASLISLSDLEDADMRVAKSGSWYEVSPWRSMANNSTVYIDRPPLTVFLKEWLALIESGSGERGIFSRHAAIKTLPGRRRYFDSYDDVGTNPCGEIVLKPYQFCNLSMAIARPGDTPEVLKEKVRLATIFGVLQSTFTDFKYLRPEWRANCEKERLLGVDIIGNMDNEYLAYGGKLTESQRKDLIHQLKQEAVNTAKLWAKKLNINVPAAVTCVKPGGDSGQFFDAAHSILPRYAPYYVRRYRASVRDPLTLFLQQQGIPWEIDYFDDSLVVFEFPMKTPEGSSVAVCNKSDKTKYRLLSAIETLENWLVWKKQWAEHNVSVTVYVREDEWLDVARWVWDNFDYVGGLTFLPVSDHVYLQAPYEEITKEEYEQRLDRMPKVDWCKFVPGSDFVDHAPIVDCSGDSCRLFS
jgi:ribonucleoside-triphosphate reductase (thioredoxin)